MSMQELPMPVRVSREDYLAAEETSVEKHEWVDGYVVEMNGGTYRHSRINSNLIRAVGNILADGPCFVLESNMRLYIQSTRRYTYPDAQIICGEPAFDPVDKKKTTLMNPQVVFEVLSDSTESIDRGDKLRGYVATPTVQAYVLVSQNDARIEMFLRQPEGPWLFQWAEGLDAAIDVPPLSTPLRLADVYAGLTFDPPPDPNAPRNEVPL